MNKVKRPAIVMKNVPPVKVEAPEVAAEVVQIAGTKHYIRRPSESHSCDKCGERCSDNGPQIMFCPEDREVLCLNCA